MPSKKTNVKRKRTSKAPFRIPRPLGSNGINSLAPSRMVTRLTYGDLFYLASSSGVPGGYQFRANSCFDPDFTGGGHQPRGLDQWFSLYSKARVLKSKITVQFSSIDAITSGQMVSLNLNTDSSIQSQLARLEQERTATRIISALDNNTHMLSLTYIPGANYDKYDQNLLFSSGADANQVMYFTFQTGPVTGTSTVALDMTVKIEYDIEFSDIITPSIS